MYTLTENRRGPTESVLCPAQVCTRVPGTWGGTTRGGTTQGRATRGEVTKQIVTLGQVKRSGTEAEYRRLRWIEEDLDSEEG